MHKESTKEATIWVNCLLMGVRSLDFRQIVRLLKEAYKVSERDWLMILVAYNHGLRASEVIALTPRNFRDGYLEVQRLKGSLKTTQELLKSKQSILNESRAIGRYLEGLHEDERIFPISRQHFWRLIQRYGKLAGIPENLCFPHVLKHTCGMEMITDAGIHVTQNYFGHKDIGSTMVYLQPSQSQVEQAVKRARRRARKL